MQYSFVQIFPILFCLSHSSCIFTYSRHLRRVSMLLHFLRGGIWDCFRYLLNRPGHRLWCLNVVPEMNQKINDTLLWKDGWSCIRKARKTHPKHPGSITASCNRLFWNWFELRKRSIGICHIHYLGKIAKNMGCL